MDFLSAKLRIVSVLVGIAIAGIAVGIIALTVRFVWGFSLSVISVYFIIGVIVVIDIIQWLFSPYVISRMYRLKEINSTDMEYSWLVQLVSNVSQANKQKMPRVFIAEVNEPNAFAFGSPIAGRRMAVTRGALNILNRDELAAVIGHEMGHLRHRDVELLMAIGLIPTLIFYFGFMLLFSGNNRNNGGYIFLIAILLVAVSFVFNLMILAVNRMREAYADINAAKTVDGGAKNLQTALAKIVSSYGVQKSYNRFSRRQLNSSSSSSAGSSFSNMLMFSSAKDAEYRDYRSLLDEWKRMKPSLISTIFSDHPHPAKRIQLLERYKS